MFSNILSRPLLAAFCAGMLAITLLAAARPETAQAASTTIIADNFQGADGATLDGRKPDTADLPGGRWHVQSQDAAGTGKGHSPMVISTAIGKPAPSVNTNFQDAAAISIASNSKYGRTAKIAIRADVMLHTAQQIGVGFFSSLPADGLPSDTNFIGITWASDKHLFFVKDGRLTDLGYFGSLKRGHFYRISYHINTTTGQMSHLHFAGKRVALPATLNSAVFTDAATAHAGFYSNSKEVKNYAFVDNFTVLSTKN